MNARQLKNALLQQAIEGRLVPQNPDDEPAAVLLQRIRAEKARLIQEGKIKKQKPLPPITDEEKPFPIPPGWEWVRLGEVIINRDAERVPLSTAQREKLEKIYDYYGASGVIDKVDRFLFDKRLLLVGEDGANLLLRSKPIAFFASGKFWVNNHAHVLDGTASLFLDYICVYINSISLGKYVTGTAQPKMNQEKMNSILIAFPPLEEQKRIVAKLEEILPEVEEYGRAQEELNALETALPGRLRKSLLQEAVEGRLVPQNPDDEPAAVLLQRIRAEKARLIKEGRIKKQKPLPPITDEEKPFPIPASWEWVRLGEVGCYGPQKTLREGQQKATVWILDLEDIEKHSGKLLCRKIEVNPNLGSSKSIFKKGNVLYSKLRPYLNKVIVADMDGCCTSEIVPIDFGDNILPQFAQLFLMSPFFVDYATSRAYGVKMPRLGTEDAQNAPFPLPPLEEQKRIVAKLEEVLPLCAWGEGATSEPPAGQDEPPVAEGE